MAFQDVAELHLALKARHRRSDGHTNEVVDPFPREKWNGVVPSVRYHSARLGLCVSSTTSVPSLCYSYSPLKGMTSMMEETSLSSS
ncbi:uncharacterized protein MYCFIDRAFT_176915 [Pseudocercospora fijiensis CIRAD86]|uniref:Uncharacterized protein n=1 Tax=Pseudocercospora fijiensis (strain CIRAD86) TaxID=383855 RepID=M2ZLG1_PSEFD|nr:uncharacterized protein MYCFIDRAFT_176915 [Pseudocercospora fijiensis CIRAD86]EME79914.1 hypothetical protein MYCFIDRAFT_176915 [Pseudocercospora fijiensis CIRAD86]